MRRLHATLFRLLAAILLTATPVSVSHAQDAAAIVKGAIDYWRDVSSYSVIEMLIHRPDWERTMDLRVWTRGEKKSLVRVTAPPKDAGNATLLIGNDMWSFSPRINRVIKVPSSMMSQSWMGSDFSNNDLAKADDLVEQYHHRLLKTEVRNGHRVYIIESIPRENAPVVWGKEVVTIRDDHLLLEHDFYDQSGVLLKKLTTQDIRQMGGKVIATRERMQRTDKPDEWTEVITKEARFGINVQDSVFTLSNLRNPRD